jgi:hypothetical protein
MSTSWTRVVARKFKRDGVDLCHSVMESSFDELVRADVERFQAKIGLKPGSDLQMILLKAHLVIEEQLQAFVDASVRDAKLLAKLLTLGVSSSFSILSASTGKRT